MKIEVKAVQELEAGRYGQTTFKKWGALIEISEKKTGDSLTDFLLTLFHELLHVWTALAKANGADLDMRKEHKMIMNLERAILREANKIRRKKK